MAPWGRKKPTKSRSEEEIFQDAIGDLGAELEQKDRRRKKRKRGSRLPTWLDRRVLIGLAVIIVIIIAEGVRRENQEFRATLASYSGQVTVRQHERAPARYPEPNHVLQDGAVVSTGPASYAVIEFPDAGVMTLDQGTQIIVRLMEYSRGGRWRSRSFYLTVGRMWARVGPNFGEQSEMKVYTPSAVAAVRGTQYAVSYDPTARSTGIMCNDGYVAAEGFTGAGTWVGQGGQTVVPYGAPPRTPEWMPAEARHTFAQTDLHKPIPPELWLKTFTLTVTQTLDAPLSILGIGKCSWGVGSADFARRTAAMEQLRRIMTFLEGYPRYPEFVNPATLEGLDIPYDEARRMLKAFHGDALLSYQPADGNRTYRIIAEARDKRRTRYVLIPTGIQEVARE